MEKKNAQEVSIESCNDGLVRYKAILFCPVSKACISVWFIGLYNAEPN